MSVHYKFKSTLDFDTITFDGLHISVADLKKSIIQQKRLGKTVDFDLQITNAQTKEEYNDDNTLIPKNTSLTIARVPVKTQGKKNWDKGAAVETSAPISTARGKHDAASSQTNVDLSTMNGTEEDKIREMMFQSTADYDPTNYQKVRGSQTGEVPINYKCYRCHKPGHWIKNCPMGPLPKENVEVKRTSGIPRSFIERDKDVGMNPAMQPVQMPPEEKQVIPEDLICSICKDLFTDAVMIPCCGSSFCDECVRTALLESEDNECPDCKEKGSSPGSLIPNRFLRNSVNAFRNETGYTKSIQTATTGRKQTKPEETPTADSTTNSGSSTAPAAGAPFGTVNSVSTGSISTTTEIVESSSTFEEERLRDADSNLPPQLFDEISQQGDLASPDQEEKETAPGVVANAGLDNESDYEDNITVTVPPAHLQSRGAFRGHYNGGRPIRHGRPHDHDTPPHERQLGSGNMQGYGAGNGAGGGSNGGRGGNDGMDRDRDEEHRRRVAMEEKEGEGYGAGLAGMNERVREYDDRSPDYLHGGGGHGMMQVPHNHPQHVQTIGTAMGHLGGGHAGGGGLYMGPGNPGYGGHMGHPQFGGGGPAGGYGMQQGGGYAPQQRSYDHHGAMYHGDRPPRMMYPMRSGFVQHHPPHLRQRPMGPGPMVGYQGVHQSIGPGVIDDPLEAFNRIMHEKELRKKQEQQQQQMQRRNRSPMADRGRRSRSFNNGGRGGGGRGHSPERRRSPRQRSPDRRRSPDDKHPDDRDRPRERRRNRSSSYSSASSRSYTRSKSRSPMKRNKSPRKRSRSPGYRDRRSRSRSGSFVGGRYRDRREDRRPGDFRDRSPGFNQHFGYGNRPPRGGGGPRGGRARGSSRDVGSGMPHFPPRGFDRHQSGHMPPMSGGRPDDIPPFMHGQHMNDYRDAPIMNQHGGMMGGGGGSASIQTGAVSTVSSNRYSARDERERSTGSYAGGKPHDFGEGDGEQMAQHHLHPKGSGDRHRISSRPSSPGAHHQQNHGPEPTQRDMDDGDWQGPAEEADFHQLHTPGRRHDEQQRSEQMSQEQKGSSVVRDADVNRIGDHRPSSMGAAGGGNHGHGRSRSRDRKRPAGVAQDGVDRDGSDRRKHRSKRSESRERREKSNAGSRGPPRAIGDHEKEKQERKHPPSDKEKRGELDPTNRREEQRDRHHRDRGKDRGESDRERDRDRDRQRERERDKEKDKTKDKDREPEHDRERERRREKDKERDKEKERERDKEREKEREKERQREKDKEREKERDRDKDKDAKELSKKKPRDSSDEERRDKKKDRDKKKRKKEKEIEKRKHKKERKEKEKDRRSKDGRKERKTVEKEEPDSSQQPATPMASRAEDRDKDEAGKTGDSEEQNNSHEQHVDSIEEGTNDRPANFASEKEKHDSDTGDSGADEEDGEDAEQLQSVQEQQQEAHIDSHDHGDLYSDIPDKYEADQLERSVLQTERENSGAEAEEAGLADSTEEPEKLESDTSTKGELLMKRSDSVLDLHANLDLEQELDEDEQMLSSQTKQNSSVLPELSKWELDEEAQINSSTAEKKDAALHEDQSATSMQHLAAGGKVTNEVLKRAENAIFTRAINAIRPIEIKKISVDRHKLYTSASGGVPREISPSGTDIKLTQEHDELKRFQVTVPLNDERVERSVEIKQKLDLKNESRSSPTRTSIKERLGNKVPDSNASQLARSQTPPNRKAGRAGSGMNASAVTDTSSRSKSSSDRRRVSPPRRSRTRDDVDNRKRTDRDRSDGRHDGSGSKKPAEPSNRRTTGHSNSRVSDDRQQLTRDRKDDRRGSDSRDRNENKRSEQQPAHPRGRSRDRQRDRDHHRGPGGRRGSSRERKETVSPNSKRTDSGRKDGDTNRNKQLSQRDDPSGRVSSSRPSHRDESSSQKNRAAGEEKNAIAPSSTTGTGGGDRLAGRGEQSPGVRMSRKRSAEHLQEESAERQHRQEDSSSKRDTGANVASVPGGGSKRTKLEKSSSKAAKTGGAPGSSTESSSTDSDSSSSDSSGESDDAGGTRSSSKKRKKRKHKKERKRAKRSAASTESDDESGGKRKKSKKKSKSSKKKKKSSKHKKD